MKRKKTWRCFHCDEVLKSRKSAADHFGNGNYERELPLCIEAATTEQATLILTIRNMWEQLQKLQSENETLEHRVSHFEYISRKLTKKHTANPTDLEHAWHSMEGRVVVAENIINSSVLAAL